MSSRAKIKGTVLEGIQFVCEMGTHCWSQSLQSWRYSGQHPKTSSLAWGLYRQYPPNGSPAQQHYLVECVSRLLSLTASGGNGTSPLAHSWPGRVFPRPLSPHFQNVRVIWTLGKLEFWRLRTCTAISVQIGYTRSTLLQEVALSSGLEDQIWVSSPVRMVTTIMWKLLYKMQSFLSCPNPLE